MRKLTFALLAALVTVAVSVACGDDDDSSGPSPTESATPASATPSQTETPDDTPADSDQKTPANETPDETARPSATARPRPTAATQGTPALLIGDAPGFLAENYPGKTVIDHECVFSPVTQITTCEGFGTYAVDPPLSGQDIGCFVLTVDDEPVLVRCTSQEPLQTGFYKIQE